MAWLHRLGNLLQRSRLASEIDEELAGHLELRAEQLESRGMDAAEAKRQARLALGNPLALRERTRDADTLAFLETLLQDARHGLRTLAKNPGFTAAAVLTLALGIGANTAVVSVVDAVILRPLPYPEADRLWGLFQVHASADIGRTRAAPLDFLDWQAQTGAFENLAAYVGTGFTFTGEGEAELAIGQLVSAELFDVLRVRPLLGRTFLREENEAGRDQVMILSHALWQRRFGRDPRVVGRTLTVNGKPYEVVGVMPPGFDFPDKSYQLWVPIPLRGANDANLPINRQSRYLRVVGRLRDGVTPTQAVADLERVAVALAAEYPDSHRGAGIGMASLTEETVGGVRRGLFLLLGAVAFVLAVACANVTSLQLTRASARQSEMAVRAALGGGRRRLVRQLLTESLVLYGLGAAAGLVVAQVVLAALQALGPRDIPRLEQAAIEPRVLAASLVVVLIAALAFGVLPTLRAARGAPLAGGGVAGRTVTPGAGRERLRAAILVAELAVSLVLLTGAGLALKSFARLQAVELGFRPASALTFDVAMPSARFPEAGSMHAFHRQLLERLGSQPLFEAVGTTTHLPLSGQDLENGFRVDGYAPGSSDDTPVAGLRGVSPGYLAAMGIPLSRGRDLAAADREGAERVALVNEAFTRRFWPGEDALGKRLSPSGEEGWARVVGVVADVRHRRLEADARPEVLLPYEQLDPGFLTAWARGVSVVVRSSADAGLVAELARKELAAVDPNVPAIRSRPVSALVAEAAAQPRFQTWLLGSFAAIALALALVGIFGVTSYFVAERRQEIGIRMALGASRPEVLALVLGRGARLALLGVVLGAAGAYALTRAMASLLFEVSPTDPATFLQAAALLALTALLAAYLPAAKAAGTEPSSVLRRD